MKAIEIPGRIVPALALAALCSAASAQDYPSRPVKIVVPYGAGGQPDGAMRVLSQQFSTLLGQPFVVENTPGSSGIAAINSVLRTPPDGYTLISADAGHWAIIPAMDPKLPYDVARDLAPIALYGQTSGLFLAVSQSIPVNTLQDLIAMAKAKPGSLSYSSAGIGSIHHLLMEDLKEPFGLDILHVPYKGSAQAVPAVIGGQVHMTFSALAALVPFMKDGRVKLLAVSTPRRSSIAPDVPTVAEAARLPDFGHTGGSALFARSGTPRAVIERISGALTKATRVPEVMTRFAAIGLDSSPSVTPEYLAERIRSDRIKYGRIVKAAKITATE